MDIRIYLFSIVLFLGVILSLDIRSNQEKVKKWYIVIIMILFILESSLRHTYIGPDTNSYSLSFKAAEFESWSDILNNFSSTFRGESKDPGYTLLVKIFQLFSNSFHLFLFIIACWFYIPLGVLLHRYSTHILQVIFAFVLYITLFRIIALSGIRQQIATGFSFFAFIFFLNKQYKKYFISVFLGSFIHISALLFLLLYVINVFANKKIKLLHWLAFLSIPLAIIFSNRIVIFMASFIKNDYYSVYGLKESVSGGLSYVALITLISFLCLIFLPKKFIYKNHINKTFYSNLPLLTFFSPLIMLDGALIRIGQYFTIYLLLLIPYLIDYVAKKDKLHIFIYCVLIAILIYMSLLKPSIYFFFWENPSIQDVYL